MTQNITLGSKDFFSLLFSEFFKAQWKGRSGVSWPWKRWRTEGRGGEFGSGAPLSVGSPSPPQGQSQAGPGQEAAVWGGFLLLVQARLLEGSRWACAGSHPACEGPRWKLPGLSAGSGHAPCWALPPAAFPAWPCGPRPRHPPVPGPQVRPRATLHQGGRRGSRPPHWPLSLRGVQSRCPPSRSCRLSGPTLNFSRSHLMLNILQMQCPLCEPMKTRLADTISCFRI